MNYTFIINEKLPSLNDYTKANRSNVYKANNMKQKIQENIRTYIVNAPKFIKPVRLKFVWIEENAKRDLDNIAFAKKYILDALVQNKTLIDDSQKYVKGFTDDFYIGKYASVIVEIEEIKKKEGDLYGEYINKYFIRNNSDDRNCNSINNSGSMRKVVNKKYFWR